MPNEFSNTKPVPFNNLRLQWQEIEKDARKDIDALFEKSAFCLGQRPAPSRSGQQPVSRQQSLQPLGDLW